MLVNRREARFAQRAAKPYTLAMTRFAALAAILLLTGCETRPLAPRPAPAVPVAFHFDEATPLLEFHYEWPAEVAAIPALSRRLSAEMEAWRSKLRASAQADLAYRTKEGFPFHTYQGSMVWTAAGQTQRLLSLAGAIDDYTGGAHGNHGTHALLWDRATDAEIGFADLFASPSTPIALLSASWCKALDAERSVKRQGAKLGGEFDECPKLSELAIVPADRDSDGRFESVRLIADPYVAGPYAEGNYKVELAVTPALIAALKPEYRPSFELQRQ